MDRILCIAGPTASGKTELAVAVALALNGEVVSCDSMQVYRRMDIGTAKPTLEERRGVPHHMLDVAEPSEPMSVGKFVDLAAPVVEDILARGKTAILAGGLLDGLHRFLHRTLAFQRGQKLFVPDGLQRRGTGRQPLRQKPPDLIQKAPPEHVLHPQVNSPVQLPPVRKIQSQPAGPVSGGNLPGLQVVLGQSLPRLSVHLQGPDDPLLIGGVQPGRRLRVHGPELFQKRFRPLLPGPVLEHPA